MKKNKIFFAGFLWNNHDKTCKIFAAKTNFAHLNKTMDIYQRYGSLKKKMDKYFLTRTYVNSRRKKTCLYCNECKTGVQFSFQSDEG